MITKLLSSSSAICFCASYSNKREREASSSFSCRARLLRSFQERVMRSFLSRFVFWINEDDFNDFNVVSKYLI